MMLTSQAYPPCIFAGELFTSLKGSLRKAVRLPMPKPSPLQDCLQRVGQQSGLVQPKYQASALVERFKLSNPLVDTRQLNPYILASAALASDIDSPNSLLSSDLAYRALGILKPQLRRLQNDPRLSPQEQILLSSALTLTFGIDA